MRLTICLRYVQWGLNLVSADQIADLEISRTSLEPISGWARPIETQLRQLAGTNCN